MCACFHRLLTVQPRVLLSSSLVIHATCVKLGHVNLVKSRDLLTYTLAAWICECVLKRKQWDPIFPFQPLMGLKL